MTPKKRTSKIPRTLSLHCNKCNHPTTHTIVADKVQRKTELELIGTSYIELWTDFHAEILQCGSCSEFALKTYHIWCDDVPDFSELSVVILPKRGVASIKQTETFQSIPNHIAALYQEIIEAYINDTNLLCAGGIRAILEAICIDKGIKGGNVPDGPKPGYKESLKGKIYGLFDHGYITNRHSEILTHHQYLGDKALHELKRPSKEELELAIEIIAHTLSSIYELEVKAAELKNKEAQRKSS